MKLKIQNIDVPSGAPASFSVKGDRRTSFHGRIKDQIYNLPASIFEVTGNVMYNGNYTVYTSLGEGDRPSCIFEDGLTTVFVNQTMQPLPDTAPDSLGYITV